MKKGKKSKKDKNTTLLNIISLNNYNVQGHAGDEKKPEISPTASDVL